MSTPSVLERMQELHKQLTYHAHLYFVENREEIPDHEYDQLEKEFNDLAEQHPALAEMFEFYNKPVPIHDPIGTALAVVQLTTPMLSLRKVHSLQDVHRFLGSFTKDTAFVYEAKLDGIALEVRYLNGVLHQITTRGSGMIGEDVTHALRLFNHKDIPNTLPDGYPSDFSVRGEGYIRFSQFLRYNSIVEVPKSNPRNAVSGWIRASAENQDENIVGGLNFSVYWASDYLGCETYTDRAEKLMEAGFWHPLYIAAPIEVMKHNIRSDDFPTDGVVIKINRFDLQEKYGITEKYPRHSVAYKYPPDQGFPRLKNVIWNVTQTGRVVPVGEYTPTRIGGVICARVLLDNHKTFLELDLREGAVLCVTRNGDVIPRVHHVKERGDGVPFKAPTECPSCGSVLEVRVGKESSDLICNNLAGCPGQLTARCVTMCDKFGLDIEGVGPMTLALLVGFEYIKKPVDLFNLRQSVFIHLPDDFGLTLQAARFQSLHRVLKAACLPEVGVVMAKRLANLISQTRKEVEDLDIVEFLKDHSNLVKVQGISTGIAMKIVNALKVPAVEENLRDLLNILQIDYTPLQDNDIKVCITGSTGQSRETLTRHFATFGIELADKLTKDCKYLIVGEKPGKDKLLKVTEFGIPMLQTKDYSSIDQLIAFIKERN